MFLGHWWGRSFGACLRRIFTALIPSLEDFDMSKTLAIFGAADSWGWGRSDRIGLNRWIELYITILLAQ